MRKYVYARLVVLTKQVATDFILESHFNAHERCEERCMHTEGVFLRTTVGSSQNPSKCKGFSLLREFADKSLVHVVCVVSPLLLLLLLLLAEDVNDVDHATRVLPAHVGPHIRRVFRPVRTVRAVESRQLTARVPQMMLEIVTPIEGPATVGAEAQLPAVATFRPILAF